MGKRLAHMSLVHPRKASWRQLVSVSLASPTATDTRIIFTAPFDCKVMGGQISIEATNATLGTVQLKADVSGTATNLTAALALSALGNYGNKEIAMASTNVEIKQGDPVYAVYTKDTNDPGDINITLDIERLDVKPVERL